MTIILKKEIYLIILSHFLINISAGYLWSNSGNKDGKSVVIFHVPVWISGSVVQGFDATVGGALP